MSEQDIVVATTISDHTALLQINRPQRLNALNLELKTAIETHVRRLSAEPALMTIVITGDIRCFVAGTDVAEMADMTPIDHFRLGTERMFSALRDCPKILIAAVEGFALGGGCELALACDLIVASESAKFGQPEINVGIMPGAGGTQLLLRTIGKYRAMKLALTGETIGAAEANAMGLISELTPMGKARERALEIAAQIAQKPPLAVYAIKDSFRIGQDAPLSSALAFERRAFQILFASADQREGMTAFMEKRKPQFRGV